MEFGNMEEGVKSDNHLTSAVAFVEGGIQEACDDTCSICLEAFCESDPSTVTCCKHEFHLQCILEWCQRSSQCPMCWQPISLKDPSSQELLDAIELEKDFRTNPHRNTTIFHHPTLGDFELQHLPVGGTDAELEERIIQHLAAAAAMGRARNIARREGQRNRSSALGRPHYLVFSTYPNGPPIPPVSSSSIQSSENESASTVAVVEPTSLISVGEESTQIVPSPSSHADQISALASGSSVLASTHHGTSSNNQRFPPPFSTDSHDKAGPSELQSFSETLKSRFNAMSTRYKESITKSTKGWKEKLFSRNTNMTDLGSEVKGAGNSGISTVPGIIERLETTDNSRTNTDSGSSSLQETNSAAESNSLHYGSVPDLGNQQIPLTGGNNALDEGTQASGGTGSAAN